ncbi:MAG TPA: glycerol dehydrogenase [Sutterella sp.]|nr:glycerol dehydrogenase [Sutterella sp.]
MKRAYVALPNYVIGPDAYENAAKIVRPYGKKAVIIGGKTAMSVAADLIENALDGQGIEVLDRLWYGGEVTFENAAMLEASAAVQAADMILAVGGGKACDTCKLVAEHTGKPLFTFPTIASNCAPCTALSIVYDEGGAFKANFYCPQPPLCVFINDEIIARAPDIYLLAGIGDALSKEPEVLLGLRHVDLDQNLLVGRSLCAACTEPLLTYGEDALKSAKEGVSSRALQETALSIIISTGLVSNMTVTPQYYYNSNLAHCFYYGTTVFETSHKYLHGVIVSLGVLALLEYDGQTELRDRVMAFNKKVGLPVKLADIGLTPEALDKLVQKAVTVPGWHIEGYDLSAERFKDSILRVDAIGRAL